MKMKPWLLASFIVVFCAALPAQRADGIYHIACMVQMNDAGDGKKTAECTTHPRQDGQIGIGGKVSFDIATTRELMDQEGAPEPSELILFLDGLALPGTHPVIESQREELLPAGSGTAEESNEQPDSVVILRVTFTVTRDLSSDKGKESWNKLQSSLRSDKTVLPVSMGLLNGPPLQSTYAASFVRLGAKGLSAFVVLAILLGIGFWAVAKKTGALRDKEPAISPAGLPATIPPAHRAYSLSRMQVAVWTLLVVYAYLFIWMITGEYNTEIPRSILAILGISGGTYVAAAAIDKNKSAIVDNGALVKAGVAASPNEQLFKDLFTGASGASLHRIQLGLWSVVLMIVFVVTVYDTLAMPNLDSSLLGLMGISSAAYTSLKIPEKKD